MVEEGINNITLIISIMSNIKHFLARLHMNLK